MENERKRDLAIHMGKAPTAHRSCGATYHTGVLCTSLEDVESAVKAICYETMTTPAVGPAAGFNAFRSKLFDEADQFPATAEQLEMELYVFPKQANGEYVKKTVLPMNAGSLEDTLGEWTPEQYIPLYARIVHAQLHSPPTSKKRKHNAFRPPSEGEAGNVFV